MRKILMLTILGAAMTMSSCDVLWDSGYDGGDYSVGVSAGTGPYYYDGPYYNSNPLLWGNGWGNGWGISGPWNPGPYPGPTRPGVNRPGWNIATGNMRPPTRPGSGTIPTPSQPSIPSTPSQPGGNMRPPTVSTTPGNMPVLNPGVGPEIPEGQTGRGRH